MLNLSLHQIAEIVHGRLLTGRDDSLIQHVETDTRHSFGDGALFVALRGANYDAHIFVAEAMRRGARGALVEQAFENPPPNFAIIHVDSTLRALQTLAAYHRQRCRARVIAITGSNGKTIAKDCLVALLNQNFRVYGSPGSYNSQVGVALALLQLDPETDIAVIEAGISQIGEMEYLQRMIRPDFGILTNIGAAHFQGFGSRKKIAVEKLKLFAELPPEGWLILPFDEMLSEVSGAVKNLPQIYRLNHAPELPRLLDWQSAGPNRSQLRLAFPSGPGASFTSEIPLNIDISWREIADTLLMAVSAAHLLGAPAPAIRQALAQFNPPLNRLEIWKSHSGAVFINDTYNSDPVSVHACLRALTRYPNQRKIFVFGGMAELGDAGAYEHRIVGEEACRQNVSVLLTVGEPAAETAATFQNLLPTAQTVRCRNIDEAEAHIEQLAGANDVIVIKGPRHSHFERMVQRFKTRLSNSVYYIRLARIKSNIIAMKELLADDVKILVMIKALGYGADAAQVARYLSNERVVDYFGVAYTSEAIELRYGGLTDPILVNMVRREDAYDCARLDLISVVDRADVAQALSEAAQTVGRPVKVHLKVDTGMGRFGVLPAQAVPLAQYICTLPMLELQGLMTHFSSADDPAADSFSQTQLDQFNTVIAALQQLGIDPPLKHAAATSGLNRLANSHYNLVRIGLGAFGVYPSEAVRQAVRLTCAVALVSRIAEIKEYPAGVPLSYGRRFYTQRPSRIAILAIGYHDGLRRALTNKGYVKIHGQCAPITGTICMDFTLVDVTDIPQAQVGDPALIFGEYNGDEIRLEDVAALIDTIPYEILCTLSPRIQRLYVSE